MGCGDWLLELRQVLAHIATLTWGKLLNLPELHGAAVRIKRDNPGKVLSPALVTG